MLNAHRKTKHNEDREDKNGRCRLAVSPETTSVNLTLCHPLPNPVCVLPVSRFC